MGLRGVLQIFFICMTFVGLGSMFASSPEGGPGVTYTNIQCAVDCKTRDECKIYEINGSLTKEKMFEVDFFLSFFIGDKKYVQPTRYWKLDACGNFLPCHYRNGNPLLVDTGHRENPDLTLVFMWIAVCLMSFVGAMALSCNENRE